MKIIARKNRKKRSLGEVVTGIVLGSVIGATLGLLMAPTSGQEIRRKITSQVREVQEKAKTIVGNVESRAR
ncbi:MAG TPA: YtxH domain-containing protein, partial [Anaerolineales bacterium]|nr:YtxH domain-containing protein [Anaerolineales bacterium]